MLKEEECDYTIVIFIGKGFIISFFCVFTINWGVDNACIYTDNDGCGNDDDCNSSGYHYFDCDKLQN